MIRQEIRKIKERIVIIVNQENQIQKRKLFIVHLKNLSENIQINYQIIKYIFINIHIYLFF